MDIPKEITDVFGKTLDELVDELKETSVLAAERAATYLCETTTKTFQYERTVAVLRAAALAEVFTRLLKSEAEFIQSSMEGMRDDLGETMLSREETDQLVNDMLRVAGVITAAKKLHGTCKDFAGLAKIYGLYMDMVKSNLYRDDETSGRSEGRSDDTRPVKTPESLGEDRPH